MAIYDLALAGNGDLGSVTIGQWITGEMDIVTKGGLVKAGQVLDKYTVLARDTTGALVPLDNTQTDGRQNMVAVLMHPVNTTAAAATTPLGVALPVGNGAVNTLSPCYFGGCFNPDLAVWPAGLATITQRVATADRTNILWQRPL